MNYSFKSIQNVFLCLIRKKAWKDKYKKTFKVFVLSRRLVLFLIFEPIFWEQIWKQKQQHSTKLWMNFKEFYWLNRESQDVGNYFLFFQKIIIEEYKIFFLYYKLFLLISKNKIVYWYILCTLERANRYLCNEAKNLLVILYHLSCNLTDLSFQFITNNIGLVSNKTCTCRWLQKNWPYPLLSSLEAYNLLYSLNISVMSLWWTLFSLLIWSKLFTEIILQSFFEVMFCTFEAT